MFRKKVFSFTLFICGALATLPIVDFQEQFSELSHGIEFELQQYRANNNFVRGELIERLLDGLANLTIEIRNITADHWAQIEANELATPECLDRLRPEFDWFVQYAALDIQGIANNLDWLMRLDALTRFNPVVAYAQRENSRAIYQTVQTLGRNQFLDNMAETVYELQDELDYYKNVWVTFQDMLDRELEGIDDLRFDMELEMEWWHEFTVRWHLVFMQYQLDRPEFECSPDEAVANRVLLQPSDIFGAKLKKAAEKVSSKKSTRH